MTEPNSEALEDGTVQKEVLEELQWTPGIDSAGIGVSVEDGVVTLYGEVDDYTELLSAKSAALRVRGVRALINGLSVHNSAKETLSENELAEEVDRALRWAVMLPESVQAEVRDHTVVLTGEVEGDFERRAAGRIVARIRGVESVDNRIFLTARPSAGDVHERIANALRRNAVLDSRHIDVTVHGGEVVLTGTVGSWMEKDQASKTAWASPHVTNVTNAIAIVPR